MIKAILQGFGITWSFFVLFIAIIFLSFFLKTHPIAFSCYYVWLFSPQDFWAVAITKIMMKFCLMFFCSWISNEELCTVYISHVDHHRPRSYKRKRSPQYLTNPFTLENSNFTSKQQFHHFYNPFPPEWRIVLRWIYMMPLRYLSPKFSQWILQSA